MVDISAISTIPYHLPIPFSYTVFCFIESWRCRVVVLDSSA